MANDIKNYTLPVPGNALRLQQDLNRDAVLSGSATAVVYVTTSGVSATVVRDAALIIQAEIDAEQAVIDTHNGDPGCYETTFLYEDPAKNGRKVLDQWFETDNDDGTYSGLAKKLIYNYDGNKKISEVTTTYYKDGEVKNIETKSYHTLSSGAVITKTSSDDGL